ncbi:hypothetical protein BC831DRAFT_467013, partial [Entophlyctis helioformis]
ADDAAATDPRRIRRSPACRTPLSVPLDPAIASSPSRVLLGVDALADTRQRAGRSGCSSHNRLHRRSVSHRPTMDARAVPLFFSTGVSSQSDRKSTAPATSSNLTDSTSWSRANTFTTRSSLPSAAMRSCLMSRRNSCGPEKKTCAHRR